MTLPQFRNIKNIRPDQIKWNFSALAFICPVLSIIAILIAGGYSPFSTDRALLYSDAYHQYYPFFKAFRENLLSGGSLLYSWDVGMGMDYLGLISYYLASPLNLLGILVPESLTLHYFSLMMPLKLGFAGLFFALFLKKTFGKDDFSITVFGCFYALCAWALGYQWNIMWLDTFALLPLLALGTISLLKEKKCVLYTVTLFLSIFANYYIGFFSCIFVLLLFICYQICRCKSPKELFLDFCRIGIFTVLAIGMTAILELPALAALQNTQSSVNSYPNGFSVNIVSGEAVTAAKNAWKEFNQAKEAGEETFRLWWTAIKASVPPLLSGMKSVAGNMNGGLEPTFKEGLPNLYCGVGSIIFAFLFLTAKEVKLRDKICSVVLLLFFMISFIIRQLDYIWHGFHFTNMIPYRFSFLFSFVMLYMAYRAYLLRESMKLWQYFVAVILAVGIMICSSSADKPLFIVYNLAFWALYMIILLFSKIQPVLPEEATEEEQVQHEENLARRKRFSSLALTMVMVAEIAANVINFGVSFPYTGISNYPSGTAAAASMIRYMKEREDDLFYRAEVTHSQTLNDGALNGYNGISTFTSSANVRVTEFMKALGYSAKNTYNRYLFEESSPVSNLFLSLKYMIERNAQVENNSYFDDVHHFDKVYLLENNAYLPLGFLTQPELKDLEFYTTNAFLFQNELFSAATGISQNVVNRNGTAMSISGTNIDIQSQSSAGYCNYTASDIAGKLIYTFTATDRGFLCLDVNLSGNKSYTVSLNGVQLYGESISLQQTIGVCEVAVGDVVTVNVSCSANTNGNATIKTGIINDSVFRRGYDILAASTWQLTEFSDTKVSGTIDCNRDGLMYTSIPYNGNWLVTVDGEKTDVELVGDCMMAVSLPEGKHTVTFSYHNPAFDIGWRISLTCLLIFLAIIALPIVEQKFGYKGKYLR